jgi:signal transduction histidine kinase
MTIELAYTLVAVFTIAFLGIIIFLHDRKSSSNILFSLISASTVLWAISNYFSLTVSPDQALFWIRLVLFFAAPHSVLFFLFIYNFPYRSLVIKRTWFFTLLFILAVIMALTVSPFVFSQVEVRNGIIVPVPGPAMPLFALVVLLSLFSALAILIFKYIRASDVERRQWAFMLFGTSLSYVLIISTNFVLVILFRNTYLVPLGPIFMLPTFIGMSYALLRYNLFNFKAIAAEIFTFIILSVSLFEVFISRSSFELSLRIVLFVLFFVFGVLLIRGVIKEVEQREELERLREQLEVANVRLAAAYKKVDSLSKAKSEFISIASHQLRTPLSAIKGYISMLLEGTYGALAEKQKRPMENVYQSNERLINLVNNLLDISRIEAGRMEFEPEETQIEEITESAVSELKIAAEKKGLYLKLEKPKTPLPKLFLDREKMRQVFLNIFDNAIKYTNQGGITIKFKIQNSKFKIMISDTGEGMTKEDLEKIFETFSRGTIGVATHTEGAGLGLYIARKFVEMHGGRVWAESEGKSKGSTFYIELPVKI